MNFNLLIRKAEMKCYSCDENQELNCVTAVVRVEWVGSHEY